jgi:hypothetical protein
MMMSMPSWQDSPVVTAGPHTLTVSGPGTALSAPLTAIGSGFGLAIQGLPNVFLVTIAGTVQITVIGTDTTYTLT